MTASKIFSVSFLIRLMVIGGLLAFIAVIAQSCQPAKQGLDQFAEGSLKRLQVLESPPPQPRMTFAAQDNREMTLADYRGKLIVLNVWATWCAPCVIEMPMLAGLQEQRGGDKFEVVTISIDRAIHEPASFFVDNKIGGLIPWHDKSFSLPATVMARGLPVSIFYDKRGRELARVSGEVDWTSPEALRLIDHLLGQ